jgi:hypothetical protein
LIENPLTNEPGVSAKHHECLPYKKIIAFKNIDIAILKMMKKKAQYYSYQFDVFEEDKKREFANYAKDILVDLEGKRETPTETLQTTYYKMVVTLDYESLYKEFKEYYDSVFPPIELVVVVPSSDEKKKVIKTRTKNKQ